VLRFNEPILKAAAAPRPRTCATQRKNNTT